MVVSLFNSCAKPIIKPIIKTVKPGTEYKYNKSKVYYVCYYSVCACTFCQLGTPRLLKCLFQEHLFWVCTFVCVCVWLCITSSKCKATLQPRLVSLQRQSLTEGYQGGRTLSSHFFSLIKIHQAPQTYKTLQ